MMNIFNLMIVYITIANGSLELPVTVSSALSGGESDPADSYWDNDEETSDIIMQYSRSVDDNGNDNDDIRKNYNKMIFTVFSIEKTYFKWTDCLVR